MKNMTTFPKRLLGLRKQHNLTQRDVASYLSIAQPSYIRYENGTAEPTLDNLSRLADLFDVSSDYLIGRSDY
ncbi:MAG: helix-turn-helix transcriptional regulator [Eubacteriales bacterium]|jgi:transcriptional regulator with XRE-family HTH domain|nr:helix-turn-helix transcriptional regulator [Eubacteriales bacterium]